MSQASPTIGANKSGLTYRQEDNDGKKALLNHHKGAAAPSYAEAGMLWLDDAATPWLMKFHDGADWITLGALHATNNTFQPYQGASPLALSPYAADTGSANAYAIAPSPAVPTYATGQVFLLKPANASTGASTLAVNSLTAKSIKLPNGEDPQAAAMKASGVYALFYDGTNMVLLNPETTGKHTVYIPAAAMIPRVTGGAAHGSLEMSTNRNMVRTLDFDPSTQEFAQFEIAMPKSWNLGTITFQPIWSHASTTTNFGVVWALQAVATSDDDALDAAFGTEQTSTDTGGTTNDRYIGAESSAITVAGSPAVGDVVLFQIKRNVADGADTLAVDARLHGIKLYYTTRAGTDA